MFDQLRKSYSPKMRCEAARALARFRDHPDVRKLLEELRGDPEPLVQRVAEHALAAEGPHRPAAPA